jgi:soluble lytic murein transglycosylase-like protein
MVTNKPGIRALDARKLSIRLALCAAGIFLLVPSSRAQIASYTDASGKRVYVNEDSPKPRSGSTINAAATGRSPAASSSPDAVKDAVKSDGAKVDAPKADAARTATANPAAASPDDRMERIVQDAASRHQVDPALVRAVINTESGWNPGAVSRKGAMGLMQLIPGTAQRFGVGDPYDPAQNVEGGTTYLRTLLDRYNGDLTKTLAAYNAGEGAVDRSGGVPWYPETRNYVRKVTDAYFRPDSGHALKPWSPAPPPVRKETDSSGRIVFTNE